MDSQDRSRTLVAKDEADQIIRATVATVNQFPELPVELVTYEKIEDAPSLTLVSVQGAYVTQEYISGAYVAEYQFRLLYRIRPGMDSDASLQADEFLNTLADWLTRQTPTLGERRAFHHIEVNSRSLVTAQYESGEEDHETVLVLEYQVSP